MVAIPLLFGRLTAADYEDTIANDPVWGPRVDALRERTVCVENPAYTADYHDPEKRSIANSLRVELNDGTIIVETVEYPIGHRLRRMEGLPLLVEKFQRNLARHYDEGRQKQILDVSLVAHRLDSMPVNEYVDLYCK
jgi:2-methylcitrate dehydratase